MTFYNRITMILVTIVSILGSVRTARACADIPVQSSETGYRQLYFLALCGQNPQQFQTIQENGLGVQISIPEPLATQLAITAKLTDVFWAPRGVVHNVYVRGGGPNKPLLLFFLHDGWSNPWALFWRSAGLWTADRTSVVVESLNRTPYEFLRKASTMLLGFSAQDDDLLGDSSIMGVAFGLNGIIYLTHDALDDAVPTDSSLNGLVLHELAHFYHYAHDTFYRAMCYTEDFGSITWKNRSILKIPLPCWFKQTNEDPTSYVTAYAMNAPAEDYADTATFALKITQRLIEDEFWVDDLGDFVEIQVGDLFFPSPNPYLTQKASYMTQKTTFGLSAQDGDADGVPWTWNVGGDCNDLNPAITENVCYPACEQQHDCPANFHCDLQLGVCQPGCLSDANCGMGHTCMFAECIPAVCGNGIVEQGEQCDSGCLYDNGWSCSQTCVLACPFDPCGDVQPLCL